MVVPARVAKPKKIQKERAILGGKVEKKKNKLNGGPQKAFEKVKNKLKNESQIATQLEKIAENKATNANQSPKKKIKQEFSPKKEIKQEFSPSSNGLNKANKKLKTTVESVNMEKKDKSSKVKKAKDPSKVTEAVTQVAASNQGQKRAKKIKKSDKGNVKPLKPTNVERKKNNYSEERVQEIRKAKVESWKKAVDFVLSKKGLKEEERKLVQKSRTYDKLPLWKKNYVIWVRSDKNYQHEKFRPLIKDVYKLLKGAERKQKRVKSKAAKETASQPKGTQAAIEKCVRLTAGDGTSEETEVKSEEVHVKQSIKQKSDLGKSKNFKDNKTPKKSAGALIEKPKKAKTFKKVKQ